MKNILRLLVWSVVFATLPHATAVSAQNPPADDTTKTASKGLPLEAERTVSFTTDEGSWISLDVSPDGQTIVFDLLGDLYTLPISGGKATRLTEGMQFDSQPRFSPDGKKVLYVSDYSGDDNLWTIDLETEETTQITKGKGNQYISPDWAPDGSYIVASRGETRLGVVKLWLGHISTAAAARS